jgi:3-oxoacyl-[acyl-carrier protein] reductase
MITASPADLPELLQNGSEMNEPTEVRFDFTGRTCVVTGAGNGIGLSLAQFFDAAGADVFMVDFDGDAVATEAAKLKRSRPIAADVRDTEHVDAAVRSIEQETGRIDILVNNAGILRDRMLWKLTDEDWDDVLGVHAGGTFRWTRACVPLFRTQGYGRVINVTSFSGLHGNPGQANYATAKAGIIGFTRTAAKELARFGVTVNAISPNADTRMIASIPPERRAEIEAGIPLGRFGTPEEMCAAVGFLASAQAGYITGVVLPVDGGIAI